MKKKRGIAFDGTENPSRFRSFTNLAFVLFFVRSFIYYFQSDDMPKRNPIWFNIKIDNANTERVRFDCPGR